MGVRQRTPSGWAAMRLAAIVLGLGGATTPACTRSEPPLNVVLISVDTLRADRLGAYGYTTRPTSPQIDTLAGQALVFEVHVAAAPVDHPVPHEPADRPRADSPRCHRQRPRPARGPPGRQAHRAPARGHHDPGRGPLGAGLGHRRLHRWRHPRPAPRVRSGVRGVRHLDGEARPRQDRSRIRLDRRPRRGALLSLLAHLRGPRPLPGPRFPRRRSLS